LVIFSLLTPPFDARANTIGLYNYQPHQSTTTLALNSISICANTPFTLTPSTNGTATSWLWLNDASTKSYYVGVINSNTTYTVVMTTSEGSYTATAEVYIDSGLRAEAQFTYGSICSSDSLIAPIHNPNFQVIGYYQASLGVNVDSLTGLVYPVQSIPGSYSVSLYSSLEGVGCKNKPIAISTIEIVPSPTLQLFVPSVQIPGDSLQISVSGATGYAWSGPHLSCLFCYAPYITKGSNARYCVIGQNKHCIDTSCTYVDNSCTSNFLYNLPNSFSPNHDGINDTYCLKGWKYCVSSFSMRIYNRWGALVFETTDSSFCWDGSEGKGNLLTEVLFYTLSYQILETSTTVHKKGNITIIQ